MTQNLKFNKITLKRDKVLKMMECNEENHLYETLVEKYEEMVEQFYNIVKLQAVFQISKISSEIAEEEKGIYYIVTIGKEVENWIDSFFSKGEYVEGLLANAMSDTYLFKAVEESEQKFKEIASIQNFGIKKRMEAPIDLPIEFHRVASEKLNAREKIGIDITNSGMFNPTKTVCFLYIIDNENKEICIDHNCDNCSIKNCRLKYANESDKYINIKIIGNHEKNIICKSGESLLDILRRNNINVTAVCNGMGTCGKCKVKWGESKQSLKEELACNVYPDTNGIVELHEMGEINVLTEFSCKEANNQEISNKEEINHKKRQLIDNNIYYVGIDIGTTTVVMQLLNKEKLNVVETFAKENPQRSYGADVISRIKMSVEGKGEQLRNKIINLIQTGIREFLLKLKEREKIDLIVISGNTTMVHLLMGYSCKGLARYPFEPISNRMIFTTAKELFDIDINANVEIFPSVCAFVGGDIVSGLYALDFHRKEKICILLDLGTNGEMAIGNCNKILTASTAAGPAFEGGNITFGMASVRGAIWDLDIDNNGKLLGNKTIENGHVKGICGSGVIAIASYLWQNKIIDETGLLQDKYFDEGYQLGIKEDGTKIVFTQKDIRELQLAKASIRVGIDTIIQKYGVKYEDIDTLYLSGGFSYAMDIKKAANIGLIPEQLVGKTKSVGNTSLAGVHKYLEHRKNIELEQIVELSEEISLATSENFNEKYLESMGF